MLSKKFACAVPIFLFFTFIMYYLDGDYGGFAREKPKYILYWTPMFERADFYLGIGNIFENCSYSNCFATNNRELMDIEKFDAILFHGPEYEFRVHGKPAKRSSHQIYVYSNQETPMNTKHQDKFQNFFNWTMTYKLDSDVIRPYGSVIRGNTNYKLPSLNYIKNKTKKIAWFVSHCNTGSAREILGFKINRHIPVHVYGLCGVYKCDRTNEEKCFQMLERDYKFYLSFENSLCEDYVTEKLYNILKRNIVPIVYGSANYEKIAPPKSVIDATKFSTISDLVRYIKRLDENPEEYLEYFKWKRDYFIDTTNEKTLCSLCKKLHQRPSPKIYENIDSWWSSNQCNEIPSLLNTG